MANYMRSIFKFNILFTVFSASLVMLIGCAEPPPTLEEVTPQSGYRAEGEMLSVAGKISPKKLSVELIV